MNNLNKFFKKMNKQRYDDYIQEKNNKFHNWLYLDDHNYITNNEKIHLFIKNIETLIKKNGYTINNEKLFKDEIASFIYNTSKFNGKIYE
tara:strand:+ start:1941 stop:2210 length:270 start_codon:yes stop_codon:yes gene_type:complete